MMYGTRDQTIIVLRVTRRCLRIVIEFGQDRHRLPLLVDLVLVPLHGESLAGASLSIGKHGRVVTLILIIECKLTSTTALTRSPTQARS